MKYTVLECIRCDHRVVIRNDAMEEGKAYELGNHVCRNGHPPSSGWVAVGILDEYSNPLYSDYHDGADIGCPACSGYPASA